MRSGRYEKAVILYQRAKVGAKEEEQDEE